jgi:hypothetical protein
MMEQIIAQWVFIILIVIIFNLNVSYITLISFNKFQLIEIDGFHTHKISCDVRI